MWDGSDLDDLSDAEIQRLVGDLMRQPDVDVSPVAPRLTKLERGVKRVRKLPGELPDDAKPSDPVTIAVDLPAYLVLGLQEIGPDLGAEITRLVHDELTKRGITWWYPLWLANTQGNDE